MESRREDEWVWGWDSTPGIVSVWAELDGRALVWRRNPKTAELVREEARFRPWLVLDRLDDLHHLGGRLAREGGHTGQITYRELDVGASPAGGIWRKRPCWRCRQRNSTW